MEVEVPKSLQDKRKEEKETVSSSMLSNLIAVPAVQATTQEKQTKSPQKIQQQFTSKEVHLPIFSQKNAIHTLLFNVVEAIRKGKKQEIIPPIPSAFLDEEPLGSKDKQKKQDRLLVQLRILHQDERLKDELVASLFTSYYFYDFLPHQQERGGLIKRTLDAENKQMR